MVIAPAQRRWQRPQRWQHGARAAARIVDAVALERQHVSRAAGRPGGSERQNDSTGAAYVMAQLRPAAVAISVPAGGSSGVLVSSGAFGGKHDGLR